MAVTASNILVEPMNVKLGRREKTSVTPIADVADALNGTYFLLGGSHYVWINTNAGVDPAPAGKTGIEVAVSTGATAAAISAAMATAVDAVSGFNAKNASGVCTIEESAIAASTAAADVDSGFTITQSVVGSVLDLGGTSGGVSVSPSVESVDVLADQKGSMILDSIQTGVNVSVSMSLLEMTVAKWDLVVGGMAGESKTPAGGTEVTGMGENKLFQNQASVSYELILEPVGAADNSRDVTFWKAFAMPGSINYSGTDMSAMEVEFKCFRDESRSAEVNLFVFGDSSQNLLA